jgi:hypothetical protein
MFFLEEEEAAGPVEAVAARVEVRRKAEERA